MTYAPTARAWLAITLLACARASAQPTYTVTPLGSLFGYGTAPEAINNAGQVVGHSYPYAFLYSDGVISNLGTLEPGDDESYAHHVNLLGQVAGASLIDDDFGSRAVLWDERGVYELGGLGGDHSGAEGINDVGQIVGLSRVPSGFGHAFLWQDGTMSDLGTLGGNESWAYAINNAGQIVGQADTATGQPVPFLWQDGAMTNLGAFPGSTGAGRAFDINDVEQVVGASFFPGSLERAFLWQAGEMIDLGTLGGAYTRSRALAVNLSGSAVGFSWTASGQSHPFLWHGGALYDLNALVPLELQGGLTIASDINDLGQIVVRGDANDDHIVESYVLTPVPEPSCLAALSLATLIAVGTRVGQSAT